MPDNTQSLHTSEPEEWTWPGRFGFRFVAAFVLLFIISLPFPHHYLPDVGEILSPLFESLVEWSGRHLFGLQTFVGDLVSDSTGLYIHILHLFFFSALIAVGWSFADRERPKYRKQAYWLVTIISYYLAFQLFEYGFNKVFKWQFYLPEPNTLFTTLGQTPRDLLYWSVMGTSRPYVIFSGLMEVLPAFLLLFRRTRTFGAMIALGVLANVVMLNFSFDISVKIYSSFLLLLSGLIIASEWKRIARFFFGKPKGEEALPRRWSPVCKSRRTYQAYVGTKGVVICLLLFDVLSPYFAGGIFNDDTAPRPPLHGGYEVTEFVARGDPIPPLTTIRDRWKRIFVHRRGYLIIQTMDDRMKDYELRLDTAQRQMLLTDPENKGRMRLAYKTDPRDTTLLRIEGMMGRDSLAVETRKIDLSRLPLLRNEFHWTIDEM